MSVLSEDHFPVDIPIVMLCRQCSSRSESPTDLTDGTHMLFYNVGHAALMFCNPRRFLSITPEASAMGTLDLAVGRLNEAMWALCIKVQRMQLPACCPDAVTSVQ